MSSALEPSPSAEEPSRDAVFEVLGNGRRRHVIRALRQAEGPLELGELAEQVAAWENDIPLGDVTYQQRKRAYTALQQSHLPKMDEAGALHYDSDRGVIEPADDLSEFDVYLEVVPRSGFPRSELYLGLAALCVVMGAVSWAGLFPATLVAPLGWGVAFVALFAAVALVHYRASRSMDADADSPPGYDQ
jgi:DNA-binding transcriptional ArsR family regulator